MEAKNLGTAFFDGRKGTRSMGIHPENYKWFFVDATWTDEQFCEKLRLHIAKLKEKEKEKQEPIFMQTLKYLKYLIE